MKVRFQYTDHSEWEGPLEDAHQSPDPRPPGGGIIRMYAIDDFGNELAFTYQDKYYFYSVEDGTAWRFGSVTPKNEFVLRPGQEGCEGEEVPLILPNGAVIRYGCTVDQEKAVAFGLIPAVDSKILHAKQDVKVECKDCE